MKKILLLAIITLIISSCWVQDNKIDKEKSDNNKSEVKISENEKIAKLEDLVNNQKFDEAIPELEKLYNSDSNEIWNILNYTSALLAKWSITRQEKEYSKKALEVLNKALVKFPNNSEIYRHIWYAYEIAEDYENAFKNYDKSIELDPNNALAFSNRWHTYRLYWESMKAEQDFQKAYKLNPNDDFVLINLAWIYAYQLQDFNLWLEYYNKAIKNTNNIRFKSEAYHSIWKIYTWKWKYKEAKEAFKNSIKADEKFELWYLWLSEVQMMELIYRSKDKTKEEKEKLLNDALKNNEIAIALNPSRALSFFNKWLILKDLPWQEEEAKLMFKIALDASEVDITLDKNAKKWLQDYISNIQKNENK